MSTDSSSFIHEKPQVLKLVVVKMNDRVWSERQSRQVPSTYTMYYQERGFYDHRSKLELLAQLPAASLSTLYTKIERLNESIKGSSPWNHWALRSFLPSYDAQGVLDPHNFSFVVVRVETSFMFSSQPV